ncbi:TetR/AcrR family transcriptional regulator [Asticcacaulis sp. BYS171W]|uniref:TetR/AcrR family transcriptional regulator n=1 Tax=Asticcacaulis aquaticus TaxID=2984212 RepID=A0ABT5HW56_9CAUL|nr:TetR/AcrR family transcriptional regulator [Asticcacaulis aquaticus]MDC7684204.1 TetR/AcrR family transcriptional regulator [Asticcacaulis aquaticus]
MDKPAPSSAVPENTAPKPRQSREARQQQILDATLRCVRRSGFHGASMSEIAAEAKMSVGVIYRYFENKEAIVEAIVANDLAEMRAKFAEWDETPDDRLLDTLLDTIDFALDHKYGPDNSALALEVLAEAARNPRVAAIVQAADVQERELGRHLCTRLNAGCDPARLDARGEIIGMLFDGMMIRAVSNPNIDRKALARELREVLRYLFILK